jgi:hypothetical protein
MQAREPPTDLVEYKQEVGMKRIVMEVLIAVGLLTLPVTALGHAQKVKVWDRIDYRDTHKHRHEHRQDHRNKAGGLDGFRIIIDNDGVTGIRYQHERRKRGIFFIGDRHQHRYEVHPHPGHRHDSRHRFRDRWPGHERPRLDHFERERRQNRAPGWSGRWRGGD